MKDKQPYDHLYHLEVTPPTDIWKNISADLDHQIIAEKLFDAEVSPPASVWRKIERSLYPKTRVISIFKYAAAAAAVIGIAFVGNFFYQQQSLQQIEKDAQFLAETANPGIENITLFTTTTQNTYKPIDKSTSPEQNTISKPKFKPRPERVYLASNIIPEKVAIQKDPVHVELRSFTDEEGGLVFNPNIIIDPNSNYLTITGPNGQQTRISSKFLPIITEINATKNQRGFYRNYPIPESDSWRQRFSEWRKKLIQEDSTKIPATNLIEILKNNGENPK